MEGKDEHSPVQTTNGTKSYIRSIYELIFSFEHKQKEYNFVSLSNMVWKGTSALVFWFLHNGNSTVEEEIESCRLLGLSLASSKNSVYNKNLVGNTIEQEQTLISHDHVSPSATKAM